MFDQVFEPKIAFFALAAALLGYYYQGAKHLLGHVSLPICVELVGHSLLHLFHHILLIFRNLAAI